MAGFDFGGEGGLEEIAETRALLEDHASSAGLQLRPEHQWPGAVPPGFDN